MIKKIAFLFITFLCAIVALNARTVSVNDLKQLNNLIKNQKAVLKFSAIWCGPCRTSSPLFEDFSNNNNYKDILFIKIDVDLGNKIATSYAIKGIPAFIFVKNGKIVSKVIGINDLESNMTNQLDKLIEA